MVGSELRKLKFDRKTFETFHNACNNTCQQPKQCTHIDILFFPCCHCQTIFYDGDGGKSNVKTQACRVAELSKTSRRSDINVSVVVTVGSQFWHEDAPNKCELPCTGIVQNWHGLPHKVGGVSNLGRLQENRMCSELHGLSECNLLPLDMETPQKLHSGKVQQRLEP